MATDTTDAEVAVPTRDGDLDRRSRRRLVAALAVTQTVGYGVLFYTFSVLLDPIAADLHTGIATVTGALTIGVVVTGVTAVPVGRWIDRHGAHALMTVGSVLATAAVVAWSRVHTVTSLYAVFVVLGVASAMVLYEPAFAVIIDRHTPARRPNALLAVTIVAGFASSVFLPLAGTLNAHVGWRNTLLILAAVYAAIAIPAHALAVPAGRREPSRSARPTAKAGVVVWHDGQFWLLLVGFTAQGAAVAAVGVHLVGYLTRLGHPPALAAAVAGLLGILSVTGRLVTTGLHRRHPIARITAAVFALQAAGIGLLPLIGGDTAGAIGCVTVFGLGFGVATIARPALIADRYGTTTYAAISGTMALPMNIAKAGAPLAGAVIATSGAGYTTLMAVVAGLCALGTACLATVATVRTPAGE